MSNELDVRHRAELAIVVSRAELFIERREADLNTVAIEQARAAPAVEEAKTKAVIGVAVERNATLDRVLRLAGMGIATGVFLHIDTPDWKVITVYFLVLGGIAVGSMEWAVKVAEKLKPKP